MPANTKCTTHEKKRDGYPAHNSGPGRPCHRCRKTRTDSWILPQNSPEPGRLLGTLDGRGLRFTLLVSVFRSRFCPATFDEDREYVLAKVPTEPHKSCRNGPRHGRQHKYYDYSHYSFFPHARALRRPGQCLPRDALPGGARLLSIPCEAPVRYERRHPRGRRRDGGRLRDHQRIALLQ